MCWLARCCCCARAAAGTELGRVHAFEIVVSAPAPASVAQSAPARHRMPPEQLASRPRFCICSAGQTCPVACASARALAATNHRKFLPQQARRFPLSEAWTRRRWALGCASSQSSDAAPLVSPALLSADSLRRVAAGHLSPLTSASGWSVRLLARLDDNDVGAASMCLLGRQLQRRTHHHPVPSGRRSRRP